MFQQEVDDFEKRLLAKKHKSGTSLLLKKATSEENTRVYAYWYGPNFDYSVDLSGYRWLNGQRYLAKSMADPDKVELGAKEVGTIMDNLRKDESLNMRFRLKEHPDIVLDIATNRNKGMPPDSLLSRKPSLFSGLGLLGSALGGLRNIRDGDRKIGDHPGQEWLMKAPNDHGQKAHLFTWEAPGLYRDALHPQIRFDLQSGNFDGGLDPGPISMTDKQMLELWDRILNSLRLRPTEAGPGMAKQSLE